MALQPRQRLQGGGLNVSGRQTNKGYYNAQRISGAVAQRQARAVQDAGNAFVGYLNEREARLGREDAARATNDAIGATDEQLIQRSQNQVESVKYREANTQVYLARQLGTLKQELVKERIRLQSENLTGEEARQRLDAYASNFINTNKYMEGMDPRIIASTFTEPLLNYNSQQADKYLEWSITENSIQTYEGTKTNLAMNLNTALSEAESPEKGIEAATLLVQDTMNGLETLDYSYSEVNDAVVGTVISQAEATGNKEYLSILDGVKAGAHSLSDRPAVRDRIDAAADRIDAANLEEDERRLAKQKIDKEAAINQVTTDMVAALQEDSGADINQFVVRLRDEGGSNKDVSALYTLSKNFRSEQARMLSADAPVIYGNLHRQALSGSLTLDQIAFNVDNNLITPDQGMDLVTAMSNPKLIKAAYSDPRISPIFTRLDALVRETQSDLGLGGDEGLNSIRGIQSQLYSIIQKEVLKTGTLTPEGAQRVNDWFTRESEGLGFFGEATGKTDEDTGTPTETSQGTAPQEAIDILMSNPSPENIAYFEQTFGYVPEGVGGQ